MGRKGQCSMDSHVLYLQPLVAVAPGQHGDVRARIHVQQRTILQRASTTQVVEYACSDVCNCIHANKNAPFCSAQARPSI